MRLTAEEREKRDREKRKKENKNKTKGGRKGRKHQPAAGSHGVNQDGLKDQPQPASESPQDIEESKHFAELPFHLDPATPWPRGTRPWTPRERRRRDAGEPNVMGATQLITRMAVLSLAFVVNQQVRDHSRSWGVIPENPMFHNSDNTPLHECLWVTNNELYNEDDYQQPNCTGIRKHLVPGVDTWFLECQLGDNLCKQEIFPHYRRPLVDEVTVRARRAAEGGKDLGLPVDPDGSDGLKGYRAALQAGLDQLPLEALVANVSEVMPVDDNMKDELAKVVEVLTKLAHGELTLVDDLGIGIMKRWLDMAEDLASRYQVEDYELMEQVISYLQLAREAKRDSESFDLEAQEGLNRAVEYIQACAQEQMTERVIGWDSATAGCRQQAIKQNVTEPLGFTEAHWTEAMTILGSDVAVEVHEGLMMADQAASDRHRSEARKTYPFGSPAWTGGITTTTTPAPSSSAIPVLRSLPHMEQVAVSGAGSNARVVLPWDGQTNQWVVRPESLGAIIWKPKGTVNIYQEEAKLVVVKDVSGTLIQLSELVQHILERQPRFHGDPGNPEERKVGSRYKQYGLYSPYSVFKAVPDEGKASKQDKVDLGHFNSINSKVPWMDHYERLSTDVKYSGHYWLAHDQVLHLTEARAQKCKHKLESSIYLFHPQDITEKGKRKRFLSLLVAGISGLAALASLGASSGALSASHANSKRLDNLGKGMTVITARVSHLARNQMVLSHSHQALLKAFYMVSKKVIKNEKASLLAMARDFMDTLVSEACYEGDSVVQELEILRSHKLPLTMVDPDTLNRALLEIKMKVKRFGLEPAISSVTELLMLPATSTVKAHARSEKRLTEEFATLKQARDKANNENLHPAKSSYLMRTRTILEAEVRIPLVQAEQQKYFRVNQLELAVLQLGQDIYVMSHPDFLLQPADLSDRSHFIQTTYGSLERDCMLFSEHEHMLCQTMTETPTDGCLKSLVLGETKTKCRGQMIAWDKSKPLARHIDHIGKEAIVFVPPGWDLELSCPGTGNYINQTWVWQSHEVIGLRRLTAPRDFCSIKISSALAEEDTTVTLAFIPEAIHRLSVASEPVQVRRLLQLLDLVDRENKALDPTKYVEALVNVTRLWHQRMNVTLDEVLTLPTLQPWDLVDLTNRHHRMYLMIIMTGLGAAVVLFGIGACLCYRRSIGHSKAVKSRMKRDKMFQQEAAAATEMSVMMPANQRLSAAARYLLPRSQ